MKNWLKKLFEKTGEVAKLYTGTFIVVMILNQLVFFGFCLNPICLIAAMPHVLLITVVVGTFINKINNSEKSKIADTKKQVVSQRMSPTLTPTPIKVPVNLNPIPELDRPSIDINQYKPPAQTPVLCPICQSQMVLRTAKQGRYAGRQFHGCSQYPQCKGIINL